jgi:hypothetical protein
VQLPLASVCGDPRAMRQLLSGAATSTARTTASGAGTVAAAAQTGTPPAAAVAAIAAAVTLVALVAAIAACAYFTGKRERQKRPAPLGKASAADELESLPRSSSGKELAADGGALRPVAHLPAPARAGAPAVRLRWLSCTTSTSGVLDPAVLWKEFWRIDGKPSIVPLVQLSVPSCLRYFLGTAELCRAPPCRHHVCLDHCGCLRRS